MKFLAERKEHPMKNKLILIFIIIFTLAAPVSAAVIDDVGQFIYETTPSPTVASVGGEWAVIGLVKSGINVPDSVYENYFSNLARQLEKSNGVLSSTKNTECSRAAIALAAIGADPTNVGGYNLLQPLDDFDKTLRQGINGAIWALIALDAADLKSEVKELYLNKILSAQDADGGWSLSGESDVDTTAMALCALSMHRGPQTDGAISAALKFLSASQTGNGGFLSRGEETCESAAQVIIALCSLGISLDDARFSKGGGIYNNLMTFYDGKAFRHAQKDNEESRMSTEQALCALAALGCDKSIYDMSDVPKKSFSSETAAKKTFSDIANHPYKKQIEHLASLGIISGIDKNHFSPDSEMTRAEFSSIVTRCLGIEQKSEKIFDDVTEDKWYFGCIAAAFETGIILGISEHEFNPNGLITKEQAAVMVRRAAGYLGRDTACNLSVLSEFDDGADVSDWARDSLAFCYGSGILPDDDIMINPRVPMTRAEIALMLYNLL